MLQSLYAATWLWLPLLIMFIVQGLHSSPHLKFALLKISRYYIVGIIAIQLLVPASHPIMRVLLFDLGTRLFLFVEATEFFWFAWSAWRTSTYQHLNVPDGEVSLPLLVWYAVSALIYLGWIALGVSFAFTLTPGM
jgi:hypothetical protein